KAAHEVEKLKQALHVPYVSIEAVCCTEDNKEIVFIGISESSASQPSYRKAPTQPLHLPAVMKATYDSLMSTIMDAVKSGQAEEDLSQGHSLMVYPRSRALQEQFISYAAELTMLRNVLRYAADAKQRAMAAQIIAYAADKRAVTDDLVYAVADPDDEVRNNATRALSVIAHYGLEHPELQIQIPAQPFISMLNSISWTDRNKAALVLFHLSRTRNPILMQQLKEAALPSLLEMVQWKSKQHVLLYYILLGRMAGLEDERLFTAFSSDRFADMLNEIVMKLNGNTR
ncbi:MAG TPA: HEAT repeat domain-containing protein, partial [Flavisolibacter sp.]|nr:HEAT repeat domain-containing protein [Flavisolibacter sp.]